MSEDLWTNLCGSSICTYEAGKCNSGFLAIFNPNSCASHIFVISFDILFLVSYVSVILHKSSGSSIVVSQSRQGYVPLSIWSSVLNCGIGLVYAGLVIAIVTQKISSENTVLPLHQWLVVFFQGFTMVILGTFSFRKQQYQPAIALKVLSALFVLYAAFISISSGWEVIAYNKASLKSILDMLTLPGGILFFLCVLAELKHAKTETVIDKATTLYTPLQGERAGAGSKISEDEDVTPFSRAGILSRLSFWWLNPILKKGKVKVFEDRDLPKLQHKDRVETCYSLFMEHLTAETQKGTSGSPPVLSTIFIWQRKAILLSGLFALTKVLALAAGPLLLKAFIQVAQGKEAFKYEGYALAAGIFLTKCIESLSERQWNFRTRLIGLQVRSTLSAAIYQKQLRLSNAAKAFHSPGQIINYVIVDAYRIGEFPYYFHQMWATSLQLCLALLIIYYTVGKATVAALFAVILIVVGNSPLAKLQHKYLTELMVARDRRLRAITEAVTNMKILKLYAWETHFRTVIEGLRKEEARWISAVLSQRGYYLALFWSSTIVITIVTFWACYFMNISLDYSTVFTFLATVRIVQEPIRLLPDVAGIFIEAKVSLARIVKFLEEPELGYQFSKRHFGRYRYRYKTW